MDDEALVGLEQALPGDQVEVVLVVEHVRRAHVQRLLHGVLQHVLGAFDLERGGELGVDGRVGVDLGREAVGEGAAARDAEGVHAGERDEVRHAEGPVAEGLDEGGHVEGGRWQGEYEVRSGGVCVWLAPYFCNFVAPSSYIVTR